MSICDIVGFMDSKTFSRPLHDAHDQLIRSIAIVRLPYALGMIDPERFSWCSFADNPDEYGVDLLGKTERGEIIHAEVEHKMFPGWNTTFPFSTLDIPGRKKKFAESANLTIFVVVNHDCAQMGIVPSSVLNTLMLERKDNIHVSGEWFYRVPVNLVRFFPIRGW